MASKISINLDTCKENFIPVKCKQNDDLTLEAFIYENGLELNLTNKEITIQALKSDNTYIIQNTSITKENNKIVADLIRDFSRIAGKTEIEIVLTESSKQNTTFSFCLEVVGSVIRGAVQSSNTATILEALDNKIIEAGQVKQETEELVQSGGAATKGEVQEINASLEHIETQINDMSVNIINFLINGEVNYTNAFSRAFEFLKTKGGGKVLIPSGEFIANVNIPTGCGIEGVGFSSVIKCPKNSTKAVIELENDTTQFIYLSNFVVDGNRINQNNINARGIYLNNTVNSIVGKGDADSRHVIDNIYIRNTFGNSFEIVGRGESQINNLQIMNSNENGFVSNAWDNWYSNISVAQCKKNGFEITRSNCHFTNCKSWMNGIYGWHITDASSNNFISCNAQANSSHGFRLDNYCTSINLIGFESLSNGQDRPELGSTGDIEASGISLDNCRGIYALGISRNEGGVIATQKYDLKIKLTIKSEIKIMSEDMLIGGLKDEDSSLQQNNIVINAKSSDKSLSNYKMDILGIGAENTESMSKLRVYADMMKSNIGVLFENSSATNENVNKTIFSLKHKAKDNSSSLYLEVLSNLYNKQYIFYHPDTFIAHDGSLGIKNNAWNKNLFNLGAYYFWVDSYGKLRIKNGTPTSDTDGTIVGTQS